MKTSTLYSQSWLGRCVSTIPVITYVWCTCTCTGTCTFNFPHKRVSTLQSSVLSLGCSFSSLIISRRSVNILLSWHAATAFSSAPYGDLTRCFMYIVLVSYEHWRLSMNWAAHCLLHSVFVLTPCAGVATCIGIGHAPAMRTCRAVWCSTGFTQTVLTRHLLCELALHDNDVVFLVKPGKWYGTCCISYKLKECCIVRLYLRIITTCTYM